jgi:hypothetical protein
MSTTILPAAKSPPPVKPASTNEIYLANVRRAAAQKLENPKPVPLEIKAPPQPTINTSGQTVGTLINTTA